MEVLCSLIKYTKAFEYTAKSFNTWVFSNLTRVIWTHPYGVYKCLRVFYDFKNLEYEF